MVVASAVHVLPGKLTWSGGDAGFHRFVTCRELKSEFLLQKALGDNVLLPVSTVAPSPKCNVRGRLFYEGLR